MRWVMLHMVAATVGCGRLDFDALSTIDSGADIDSGTDGRIGEWSVQPMAWNTAEDEDDPTATADLLELYFNRSPGIWRAVRASPSDPWGPPAPVTELNTAPATNPDVSFDGLELTFGRRGVMVNYEIFRTTRANRSDIWGAPVRIDELATNLDEVALVMDASGLHGVHQVYTGTHFELVTTTRAAKGAPWSPAVPIAELNTTSNEESPFLTADGLTLYFESNRPGSMGVDIYYATRPTLLSPFGPAIRDDGLSSAVDDGDPWISVDGRYALIFRTGAGGRDIAEAVR